QITSASIGTLYNTTFDAINLFVTHASVSDDLSVVNNIHISSGVIDVDGLASSSFAGDLDVEGDVNFGGNDFYVDASTGRVGIGTTTPNTWLDIAALTNAEINLRSTDAFLSAGDIIGKIGFYKTDDSLGGSGIPVYIQARAYDEGGLFDLDFITGSVATPVTAMTIDYLGNVGIGTTSPDAKLDVAGQIISSSSWTKHASVSDDFETLSAQITSASIGTLYNTTFDATNLFAIHASISDDFETLSAQITSASLGSLTVSGTATSSFAGPISVNDKIVASRLGYFGKYNSAEVQGIWSIGGAFDVDTANNNFGNQYGMGYAYNQVGGSPFANEHQIVFTNNGTINAAIGLSGSGYFAGNVGIGTTSPDAKLDVAGQIISSSSWTKHASVSDDFETLSAQITSASLGSLTVSGTATSSFAGPVNIVGDLDVQSGKLFVDQSSGNVGIGTTNPKYKLSVDGTASISGILYTDTNVNIGGNLDVAGGNITSFNAAVSDANATLPHIVLDSTGSGDNWADQGAYISLGEGGDLGSAATHLTYRGDGYGYVGAGTVVDGEPAGGYWRFKYNSEDVYTDGSVQIADNLQVDGGTITLGIDTNFVLPGGINGVSFNTDTLSIDAANNRVGIGTTAPGAKLQITSDGAGSGQEQFVITGLIDPNKKLRLGYDTVGNFGRIQALTSGTSYDNLVLNADGGNVGIGDTNPGYTLSVDGTASISGNLNLGNGADNTVLSLYSAGGTYDTRIQWYGSDGLSDYYVGLTSDGGDFNIYNYMYNAYALIIDSATNNIAIGPDFSPDAGLEITASGSIGYLAVSSDEAGANNGDVFIVDANKNVGIASASPDEKLSVNGNINFTGKLLEDGNEFLSGVIAMFDTSCPTGWTRFTALDGKFAYGGSAYGATGGDSTHFHSVDPPSTTVPAQTDSAWDYQTDARETPRTTFSTKGHTHAVDIAAFTSGTSSSLPPYLTMVFCKKNAGADVAEWTQTKEQYEPGTIVSLDQTANERVEMSAKAYDSSVIGIISTQPGWTVGYESSNTQPLALSGRVPVKVSSINGQVKIGDSITTSSIPGIGMKATQSGQIIGKAMSNFDDNSTSEDCVDPLTSATFKCGEIVVFVNLSWYGGEVVEKIDNIFNMNNTSQETMVLSIDDLGVLNIDATTSISQDLYVGNKLYVDGMDVKDEIEKLKLAINSQGTIGTIIETSNPILPTSELMASVIQGFKDLGIEIYNGIIKVAQIVVKTLVVEKNSDQTQSSIGEGTIKAEETSVIIESNQVLPTSKIFVTFRSDYGSRWWIGYQEKGRFTVNIADPLSENVKFDWWIVQTEQVEIVETATETPVEVP
ncbi:MAG: hypothetical protein PHY37_02825, partial [Candidatus Portnoybacteria bacterium]|nr:hypothetical protein [Candidatus Portnoybacteria bacterium]